MPRIWRRSSQRSTRPGRPTSRGALLSGLLALLIGAASLLILGRFPQQPARRYVEARLQELIGPSSRIGRLQIVPGRLEAEAFDVVLAGPGYRVELPHARLRLAPAALLRGVVVVRSLEGWQPRIVIEPQGAGKSAAGPHVNVLVEQLTLLDGSLVYRDARAGGEIALEGVAAHGAVGRDSLEITASHGSWARATPITLGPLTAHVALSPSLAARLLGLEAGTELSQLRVSGELGALAEPRLDLAFTADVDLRDAASFVTLPASGRIQLAGRASGPPDGLRLESTIAGRALVAYGQPVDRLEAQLESDSSESRVLFHLGLLSGQVGGEARVKGPRLDAHADFAQIRLERVSPAAPAAVLWGRLEAHGDPGANVGFSGELHGAATTPSTGESARPETVTATVFGSARIPARALEARVLGRARWTAGVGAHEAPFEGSLNLEGDRLRVDLEAQPNRGRLQASLESAGSRLARLDVRGVELDPALFLDESGGRLDFEIDMHGPGERLSGVATARLTSFAWRGVELGACDARLVSTDGRGHLAFSAPGLNAHGDADLELRPGTRLTANLRLADAPLAPFAPLLPGSTPRPIDGRLSALVRVEGRLDRLADVALEAHVSKASVTAGDWKAQAGSFTARRDATGVTLDGLVVALNGATFEASGRLAQGGSGNDLRTRFAADLGKLPFPEPWTLAGGAQGQVRITGALERPRLEGRVQASGVRVARPGAPPIVSLEQATLDLAGERIAWTDVAAELAGGSLTSSGDVPLAALVARLRGGSTLAAGERAQLSARWQDVAAARLMDALGLHREEKIDVLLAGDASLSGGFAAAAELEGVLRLAAAEGMAAGVPLVIAPLEIAIHGGAARLSPLEIRSGDSALELAGRLELAPRTLSASARGRVDLRALSPFFAALSLGGFADLDLAIAGSLAAPVPRGSVELRSASFRSAELAQPLTGVEARMLFAGGELRVESFSGRFGGGTLEVHGSARNAGLAWSDVDLAIAGRDIALFYPGELKSRVAADLKLRGASQALRLEGEVRVERGLYDSDYYIEDALFAPKPISFAPPSLLKQVALDLRMTIGDAILVHNNLADLRVTGALRLEGDLAEPSPHGRLEIAENGIVYLQTRKFTVISGSLDYDGTLDPAVRVSAETVLKQTGAEDVTVTVSADGPLSRPVLSLSSDPSYSEREIASLIATGRRGVDLDQSGWVMGEQGAALLAGRLTRNLSKSFLRLGFDEVEIQPELMAREADPGARFTLGKQVTPRVKLTYSLGLNGPESNFYQAEYQLRRKIVATARIQRDDTGEYSYGLGQKLRWGAPSRPPRDPSRDARVRLSEVKLAGDAPLAEAELRHVIGTKAGDVVTPWDIQAAALRVEQRLAKAGYLEALVSARSEDTVALFDVSSGPRYRFEVVGVAKPAGFDALLESARFEGKALQEGRRTLLSEARARGFLRASVEPVAQDAGAERVLVFTVKLGAPMTEAQVSFPGAQLFPARRLLELTGGVPELLAAPDAARKRIEDEYRASDYLVAQVGEPVVAGEGEQVQIAVPVKEGPRARIDSVTFEGVSGDEQELRSLVALEPGAPYHQDQIATAVLRLRDRYLKRGFPAVRVAPRLVPLGPDLIVRFIVSEGEPRTIGAVVIEGLRRTRESVVRRRIDLHAGEPLDPRRLGVVERRLRALGTFARASVTAGDDEPATIRVEVEERGPYALAYDMRFSATDRWNGVVDAERGNLAGLGLVAGARFRLGRALREERLSLSSPPLGKARGVTLSVFERVESFHVLREVPPGAPATTPYDDTLTERGFGVQHAYDLSATWKLVYGYRGKRVSGSATGFRETISSLQPSLLNDTRNDALDPRTGHLWGLSFDLAPRQLGSSLAFFRVFGQAFSTRPLGSSWTWAQGYRLGIANGLDDERLRELELLGRGSELFRAGGANSLRGFATDSVGPHGALAHVAVGGEAVAIVNQELRYHRPSGLGAAIFYDAGNVFPRMQDLSLNLRHSAGFGLRYGLSFGLLRLDFGFPLDRRANEPAFQWFFSLGQAF